MKKFLNFVLVILFFACLASNFLPAQIHQTLGLIFIALIILVILISGAALGDFFYNFADDSLAQA